VTNDVERHDVLVVGAGISGLACAHALAGRGRRAVVFERSRGVGGRCATRRVAGQPVDHGAAFLHGSDASFLAAIRGIAGETVLDGWPRKVGGAGAPCSPKAFTPRERRVAYAGGVTAFPKSLAQGLDVRLASGVESLAPAPGGIVLRAEGGASAFAPSVVLAVPPPSGRLLGMIGSQACLTVLAGFPPEASRPPWDIAYPEDSSIVQMISHDSSKRAAPPGIVLVIQARPCWSRVNLNAPESTWMPGLLDEAARLLGLWVKRPSWSQAHRWRFARSDSSSELTRPVSLRVRGGGRVILTGEAFAPGGGLEASWLAGNAAAARLFEEE